MVKRVVKLLLRDVLKRNKSVLLLGPRQTGKTTLIKTLDPALYINLALTKERRRFELDPDLIVKMVDALQDSGVDKVKYKLVIIDEIQKVPAMMDPIQTLIDDRKAIFVLTGSSVRKIKRQTQANLLPGRVINLRMDGLSLSEYQQTLLTNLYYGNLPEIVMERNEKHKSQLLRSYVDSYLEEEVRAEALVRNLPAFYRFLELAALESGKIISFNAISKEIGVAHTTVSSYFEILEDCLIIERVDPIVNSISRKKLTKSSKYLFFDLGVRRIAANEGSKLGIIRQAELFENYCGLEFIKAIRNKINTRLRFWRDPDGPEVDWVLESEQNYIPIEIKWKEIPTTRDCRHLLTFLQEYPCKYGGFIVCQTPRRLKLSDAITAIPWEELTEITKFCK